jgi:hypothetical protein
MVILNMVTIIITITITITTITITRELETHEAVLGTQVCFALRCMLVDLSSTCM